ncbi:MULTISPECIES: very short patch repair endonuclease [unclassified Oleiphilus]|uniref:very short patch repair endonuclease n=1 Tax=unclassified Oleiphilus TaxID=2631174 RepID=UPI0007C252A8|nr:very short patch repair endonuclease [Oleiphilus sp. HI0043]KZZ69786.1 very short patch repair endonuclease [Oleiphilus sp. HI0128]
MADKISKARRSQNMAQIKGKNTTPELEVRKFLHKQGFRFRLHSKDLPGKPDIVLPKYKTVLFVNGCYWHRHENCHLCTTPKSNVEFWQSKFEQNMKRDKRNYETLDGQGWKAIIIWECEIKNRSYENWISDTISKNLSICTNL